MLCDINKNKILSLFAGRIALPLRFARQDITDVSGHAKL